MSQRNLGWAALDKNEQCSYRNRMACNQDAVFIAVQGGSNASDAVIIDYDSRAIKSRKGSHMSVNNMKVKSRLLGNSTPHPFPN